MALTLKKWFSWVLLLITLFCWQKGGCQTVILDVLPPDSQPVCPNQPVMYQCQVLNAFLIRWYHELENLGNLTFGGGSSVNVPVSAGGGQFSAALTEKMMVEASRNEFTSILTIQPNLSGLNGTNLTCERTADDNEQKMITIAVYGAPDSPRDLIQDTSANTESSAVIQWQTPLYTGGSIASYNIIGTGNGLNLSDSVSSNTYIITELDYNTDYTFEVTAVNSCGQESGSVNELVNIDARAPPTPAIQDPELSCDNRLEDGTPVLINWIYGNEEADVVYPQAMVSVMLDPVPVDITCSGVTTGVTSCTVNITSDGHYTVSLTLTNDVNSSQAQSTFNLSPVQDSPSADQSSVTVTLNGFCRGGVDYTVFVSFGVRDNGGCSLMQNMTSQPISPGGSAMFTTTLTKTSQMFCYQVFLNGQPVIPDDGRQSDDGGIPTGAYAGIGVAAVVIIAVIIAIILVVIYKYTKKNKKHDADHETSNLTPQSPVELTSKSAASGDPAPVESSVDQGPMYQNPNTITHTAHPATGELYTDVNINKKKKKGQSEDADAGPMYQDPHTIEHQQTDGGDLYAMPQKKKKGKKGKKEKGGGKEEEELTEEEKAALYSMPDRKTQKAKSEGLMYAELDMHSSSKPPQPSQPSLYAEVQHQD